MFLPIVTEVDKEDILLNQEEVFTKDSLLINQVSHEKGSYQDFSSQKKGTKNFLHNMLFQPGW